MPAAIMECSTHVKHRSAYSMSSTHMHAHRVDQVPGSSTTRGCARYGLQANPAVEQPVGCTSGAFSRFTMRWPGSLLSVQDLQSATRQAELPLQFVSARTLHITRKCDASNDAGVPGVGVKCGRSGSLAERPAVRTTLAAGSGQRNDVEFNACDENKKQTRTAPRFHRPAYSILSPRPG